MNEELTIDDLRAVSLALDGWLDAFQDDDVFTPEEVESVRRVMKRIDGVIASAKAEPKKTHLRLVGPGPEDIQ